MVENKKKKGEIITSLPSRSGNKTLYLVIVEDPVSRLNKRFFATKYLSQTPNGVDFVGYEIPLKVGGCLTEDNALDLINKGNRTLISVLYPWHRVISIINTSYKEAKYIKNTVNASVL